MTGPPGVGKTLTAETVALATGKPLLPISVAEISIEPNKAEKNLVEIFADAGRWEAVLLMYVPSLQEYTRQRTP
jgi:SpoVK/Ycf46/Vps4 family AAA+-type ATPase